MTSKIAIVTGGSRGIGRNIVESLARRGVDTIFTYHTHAADAETVIAEAAAAKAVALQLDTGDVASFDAFVGSVKDALATGTVRNLVCGAIVTPMEGAYGNQERHPGRFAGGA